MPTTTLRKHGWLLRQHAAKPEDVHKRSAKACAFVHKVRKFAPDDHHITIQVAADLDCGDTVDAIKHDLHVLGLRDGVRVVGVSGSNNTDVLNDGLRFLAECNCTHVNVVSGKATQFITADTVSAIGDALDTGALVVGVTVDPELFELVKAGLIQNTFAVWHLRSLFDVDGFSVEFSGDKGGVEETFTLLQLVRRHGQCLAVVEPVGVSDELQITDPERADVLKRSKQQRQLSVLDSVQAHLYEITDGLMDNVPVQAL